MIWRLHLKKCLTLGLTLRKFRLRPQTQTVACPLRPALPIDSPENEAESQLVGVEGFEPPTLNPQSSRSTRLSYTPTMLRPLLSREARAIRMLTDHRQMRLRIRAIHAARANEAIGRFALSLFGI